MVLTFFGRKRWIEPPDGKPVRPHESPWVMTAPMALLAVGSVGAGYLLSHGNALSDWLSPVVGSGEESVVHKLAPATVSWSVLGIVVLGVTAAVTLFARGTARTEPLTANPIVLAARRNLYADAVNEAIFARLGAWFTRALVYVDSRGVDGMINGLAAACGGASSRLRRIQTGFVRSYSLTMLAGVVIVVVALSFTWWR
jgi:NADH-quinone oxidoreductase subunit L